MFAAGQQCSLVGQQLWLLLLQLQATDASSDLAHQAAATSERLAAACGQSSATELASIHAPALINTLTEVFTLSQQLCRA